MSVDDESAPKPLQHPPKLPDPGRYEGPARAAPYALSRMAPSYALIDAVLNYDLGQVSPRLKGFDARVNAANLFDKRHITSCYVNGVQWCWYGSRRTVSATIGYHW